MSSFYTVLTHQSDDIRDDTLIKDIETHLVSLLNARQATISTLSDYGLPDICAEITSQYSNKIIEATRELITRYEPRLKIQDIICENPKRPHNQIHLRVYASVDDSTLIELSAKLGAQRPSSVSLV